MRIPKFYKSPLFYVALFLMMVFGISSYFYATKDTRQFSALCETIFQHTLTSNPLNLHYTLAYPEHYGITSFAPNLPIYSKEDSEKDKIYLLKNISWLQSINKNKLNSVDTITYSLLENSFFLSMESLSYPYYSDPLTPTSGAQTQLLILLAEYTFRQAQDVDTYLTILESSKPYFEALLTYEKEKKEAGLFMSYASAREVASQCKSMITLEDLKTNTHFLQTTFLERLQSLQENNLLTQEQLVSYEKQHTDILINTVLPTYENLALTMNQLADTSINVEGLSHHPQGKDYYCYLLKSNVSSYRPIADLKQLLNQQLKQETTDLRSLCADTTPLVTFYDETSYPNFSFSSEEDMLLHLQEQIAKDFPPVSKDISYEVKSVSKSLENFTSPAFYLTPPIDDSFKNVIYINHKNKPNIISLYTTLAHEGFPGHLYQSVYHQTYAVTNNLQPVQELLWYGGYLEGWALYVEFSSYDFLAKTARDNGETDFATYIDIEKHNRQLQLCLFSLLDVAIHYDGANYQKVHDILSSYGVTDPTVTFHIYEYICNEPTTYLKYYLGYLEILQLKEKAKVIAADSYTDYHFHQFLLNHGPADFTTLSEALEKYF